MASFQVDGGPVVEDLAAAPAAEVELDDAVAAEVEPAAVVAEQLETSEADGGAEEVPTLGEAADGEPAAEAEVADATATAAEEPAVGGCEE